MFSESRRSSPTMDDTSRQSFKKESTGEEAADETIKTEAADQSVLKHEDTRDSTSLFDDSSAANKSDLPSNPEPSHQKNTDNKESKTEVQEVKKSSTPEPVGPPPYEQVRSLCLVVA